MSETVIDERTRVLDWIAAYAHIEDHWVRSGRPMTDDQKQSFANAVRAQKQHGITDAEVDAYRRQHKASLDALAARQA